MKKITVLIPTYNRPLALAITLTSLCAQSYSNFDVIVSDQSDTSFIQQSAEFLAIQRALEEHACNVSFISHLPRRGMAEHRQFLLDQVTTDYCLFLDDDLILEPYVIENMINTIEKYQCGFVGSAVIGLSFKNDRRPHQQKIEFWKNGVYPEVVEPESEKWYRYELHNAANIHHVTEKYQFSTLDPLPYKVAWVGGCVLYNTRKLRNVDGFTFWKELPQKHCGEDVLAQLRVMEKYGGCGIIPSGVYHQEVPTTLPDRTHNAPLHLSYSTVNML